MGEVETGAAVCPSFGGNQPAAATYPLPIHEISAGLPLLMTSQDTTVETMLTAPTVRGEAQTVRLLQYPLLPRPAPTLRHVRHLRHAAK